jgi:uncharacterized protein (TIGR03067 family)
MRSLLSALFVSALVVATAPAADFTPAGDLARLQGRWTTRAGPRRDIQVVLEVEGHQVRLGITTPLGLAIRVQGEVAIDETAAPRTLDWTKLSGLDGQDLPDVPAIYEIQGDAFRVCNGGPHGNRPTEFKAGEGLLADLLTFERSVPATAAR